MGRWLRIGHRWRDRATGEVWWVWQIHRADCQVELRQDDAPLRLLPFAELRIGFVFIADQEFAA